MSHLCSCFFFFFFWNGMIYWWKRFQHKNEKRIQQPNCKVKLSVKAIETLTSPSRKVEEASHYYIERECLTNEVFVTLVSTRVFFPPSMNFVINKKWFNNQDLTLTIIFVRFSGYEWRDLDIEARSSTRKNGGCMQDIRNSFI